MYYTETLLPSGIGCAFNRYRSLLANCFRAREESRFAASGGGPVIIAFGSLENA